jgi:hypothetical protein
MFPTLRLWVFMMDMEVRIASVDTIKTSRSRGFREVFLPLYIFSGFWNGFTFIRLVHVLCFRFLISLSL